MRRLDVQTPQVPASTLRAPISIDFIVEPDTKIVDVQLRRRRSLRFDNKIAGTLHVYETSLVAISTSPE